MAATLTGYLMASQEHPEQLYKVGLGSVRFLLAAGDLLIGWRLLVSALVVQSALPDDAGAFYAGKIAAAKFFAHNVLPMLTSVREVIESLDVDVMELPADAF